MITAPMAPYKLLQKYGPQSQPQFRPFAPAKIGGALGNNFDPGWRQNIPQPQNMPMPQQVKNRMAQGMADAIGGSLGGYNPQGAAGGEAKRMGGMKSQKGILSAVAANPAQFRQALRKR